MFLIRKKTRLPFCRYRSAPWHHEDPPLFIIFLFHNAGKSCHSPDRYRIRPFCGAKTAPENKPSGTPLKGNTILFRSRNILPKVPNGFRAVDNRPRIRVHQSPGRVNGARQGLRFILTGMSSFTTGISPVSGRRLLPGYTLPQTSTISSHPGFRARAIVPDLLCQCPTASRAGLPAGIRETGVAARSAFSTAGSSGITASGDSSPISMGAAPVLYWLKITWIFSFR